MSKPKARKHRHLFIFRSRDLNGQIRQHRCWTNVKQPKTVVDLLLTAEHVKRSMKLKGVGNTQTCSMAICSVANKHLFGHPVVGYIDWYYSTAYVASKLNADGFPCECYRYVHGAEIDSWNDSKDGQRRLLEWLQRNGDQIIRLRPRIRRDQTRKGGTGTRTGTRSGPPTRLKGAKLRAANVQLGLVPIMPDVKRAA